LSARVHVISPDVSAKKDIVASILAYGRKHSRFAAFKRGQCFRRISRPKKPNLLFTREFTGLAAAPALLALFDELRRRLVQAKPLRGFQQIFRAHMRRGLQIRLMLLLLFDIPLNQPSAKTSQRSPSFFVCHPFIIAAP